MLSSKNKPSLPSILTDNNRWYRILKGDELFEAPDKNEKELLREYESETWKPLFNQCKSIKDFSVECIEDQLFRNVGGVVWDNGRFNQSSYRDAHHRQFDLITQVIKSYISVDDSLVEWGSGCGTHLIKMAEELGIHNVVGLDFCPSGTLLLKAAAEAEESCVRAGRCNLLQEPPTEEDIPPNSIFFTSYVASLFKDSETVINNLLKYKPGYVFHFEPCYEGLDKTDELDSLQKKYIELNNYNRDLMSTIEKFERLGRLKIIKKTGPIFGKNPFFRYSVIAWKTGDKNAE